MSVASDEEIRPEYDFSKGVRQRAQPKEFKLCPKCDQPVLPVGIVKQKDEYDHASGCPDVNKTEKDYIKEGVSLDTKVL